MAFTIPLHIFPFLWRGKPGTYSLGKENLNSNKAYQTCISFLRIQFVLWNSIGKCICLRSHSSFHFIGFRVEKNHKNDLMEFQADIFCLLAISLHFSVLFYYCVHKTTIPYSDNHLLPSSNFPIWSLPLRTTHQMIKGNCFKYYQNFHKHPTLNLLQVYKSLPYFSFATYQSRRHHNQLPFR